MSTSRSGAPRLASGLAFALVSALTFGVSGALATGLLASGWSAGAAVGARITTAALVLVVPGIVALRGEWEVLRRGSVLVVLYGLLGVAGAQLCFFYAVSYLDVGLALLLEYTAPLAVVAWMWLRHQQRPTRLTAVGALITAGGLVLLLEVFSGGSSLDPVGVAWGLAAMVGAAACFVIGGDTDNGLPPLTLAAGGLVVGGLTLGLAGAVGVLPMDVSTAPVTYRDAEVAWWVPLLLLGLVAAAIAYVTGIAAARRLGSRLASFVALVEVVAAVLFAWLLLGQLPHATQVVGGVLVLGGVVVVKLGEAAVPLVVEPLPELDDVDTPG